MSVKRKVSLVKRRNQKRGKLNKQNIHKPTKTVKKNVLPEKVTPHPSPPELEEDTVDAKEMLEMIEQDDIDFMKNAIRNRSYRVLNNICHEYPQRKKRRKVDTNDESLEKQYEEQHEDIETIAVKDLLPIKTQTGFVSRQVVVEPDEQQLQQEMQMVEEKLGEEENSDDEIFSTNDLLEEDFDSFKPVSVAQLFAQRNKILTQKKLEIGVLSSQVLENPDEKVSNLRTLIRMLDDQTPEVFLTIRKLAIVSLLEVFKDVLPTYKIRVDHHDGGVLLKKTTMKLRKFETELLHHYRKFLQRLEKSCMALHRKRGNKTQMSKERLVLGELSLQTMCGLFVANPYFNYSENIAQVVVPFLNYKDASIREIAKSAVISVFKEDKRHEVTLKIVRLINHYLKTKAHNARVEMLEVLLQLKLENVNLEQEKEINMKQKKLESKKQNILQISKKERKRKKQLQRVQNELLEAKAEENKATKEKKMVEITKLVFGIYFRILKSSSNNKTLGKCLEGLAKYAHCISIDYYVDIVNLLDNLLQTLGFEDQIHCIQTVFAILSGEGEYINLDPTRFYNNLYKNLIHVSAASKTNQSQLSVLRILYDSLIKRRKKNSNKRTIGFTKRLALMCLQQLHHGALGTMGVMRNIMQLNKSVDILLETDKSEGDGVYNPEVDNPEYANASSTTLYEMVLLCDHYHPTVKKFAKNIAAGVPSSGDHSLGSDIGRMAPVDLFQNYDMTEMAFSPPVAAPKKTDPKAKYRRNFTDTTFEDACKLEVENWKVNLSTHMLMK